MSRAGYSDCLDSQQLAMWRGQVASATRGKRGQRLLRDLRDALDAMPVKALIAHELVNDGDVCALGAVGMMRKTPELEKLDPEDYDELANAFDASACLIREIEYINDEWGTSPENRWQVMRNWVEKHIKKESDK